MKLREVASLSSAVMNGTHRPAHKVGRRMVAAGYYYAVSGSLMLKTAVLHCAESAADRPVTRPKHALFPLRFLLKPFPLLLTLPLTYPF